LFNQLRRTQFSSSVRGLTLLKNGGAGARPCWGCASSSKSESSSSLPSLYSSYRELVALLSFTFADDDPISLSFGVSDQATSCWIRCFQKAVIRIRCTSMEVKMGKGFMDRSMCRHSLLSRYSPSLFLLRISMLQ
jgi:hypothetical protein